LVLSILFDCSFALGHDADSRMRLELVCLLSGCQFLATDQEARRIVFYFICFFFSIARGLMSVSQLDLFANSRFNK
jgi:hypothetical protein